MVTQKAQLGVQTIYLIEQIEHGFKPGQIDAVNGSQVFDLPNGVDRLFCEFHHAIRRQKDRSDKPGATINQDGTTGDAREMGGCIKAVENVWLRLKQLQSNGGWSVGIKSFAHEGFLGLKDDVAANRSHSAFCSGVTWDGTAIDTMAYRSPLDPLLVGNPFPRKRNFCSATVFAGIFKDTIPSRVRSWTVAPSTPSHGASSKS